MRAPIAIPWWMGAIQGVRHGAPRSGAGSGDGRPRGGDGGWNPGRTRRAGADGRTGLRRFRAVRGSCRPDGAGVRPRRAGVRCRKARDGPGLRFAGLADAAPVRRPADQRAQLLGPGVAGPGPPPGLPRDALCLRPVHVRRAPRRDRSDLGRREPGRRRLPDAAGGHDRRVRGAGPSVAAENRCGRRLGRYRGGADPGLVPAVSQPFDRGPAFRCRRDAVCQRRRGGRLQFGGLGPIGRQSRQPGAVEPVRGSSGRCGRHHDAADGRRRRLAVPAGADDADPHRTPVAR